MSRLPKIIKEYWGIILVVSFIAFAWIRSSLDENLIDSEGVETSATILHSGTRNGRTLVRYVFTVNGNKIISSDVFNGNVDCFDSEGNSIKCKDKRCLIEYAKSDPKTTRFIKVINE